ncbi:unnamed protein product [Hapterophycus canaliculatus]
MPRQALMELGATVCTVKSPSCTACPVRTSCLANKLATAAAGQLNGQFNPQAGSQQGATARPTNSNSRTKRPNLSPAPVVSRMEARKRPVLEQKREEEQRTCCCDVCEIGEDGMATLPTAVTDFPRKAAKT